MDPQRFALSLGNPGAASKHSNHACDSNCADRSNHNDLPLGLNDSEAVLKQRRLSAGPPSAPIWHTDATYARAPAALAAGARISTANRKVRVSVIWLPERNPLQTTDGRPAPLYV